MSFVKIVGHHHCLSLVHAHLGEVLVVEGQISHV
jgi:hypothetical protein